LNTAIHLVLLPLACDYIRRIMGKPYTSEQMERTIRGALDYGAKKLDIYFMVGISGQTPNQPLDSVEYA